MMMFDKTIKPAQVASMVGAVLLAFGLIVTPSAAAEKTTDEIAKELTNPNNDLAKLGFKNQWRQYKGDLPNAGNQSNYTMLFQPVFPFSLGTRDNGDKATFFLRPAVPLVVDQPYFTSQGFEGETALGDIGFDAAIGITKKSGFLYAGGLVGTLPTATSSEVAGGQWRLGPEVLLAHFSKWGLVGVFPSHQWNVGGWRGENYSTTSLQVFAMHTAGGGWVYGTQPISTYNWQTEKWTIPVQAYISKTVKMGSTPVKIDLELNYYVEQENAFGPRWMIGLNFTPVVNNFVEDWFKKKK